MNKLDLDTARLHIIQTFPFLAHMASLLRFKEVKGLGTVGCDQKAKIYYDPDLKWDSSEINMGLLHEVLHLIFLHFPRWQTQEAESGEKLIHQVANIAGDCEINPALDKLAQVDNHFRFRSGYGVFPAHFNMGNGLTAEQYYERLMKNAVQVDVVVKGKGLHSDCGSAADGNKRDHEDDPSEGSGPSEEQLEHAASQAGEELEAWAAEVQGEDEAEGSKAGKGHTGFKLDTLPTVMTSKYWLDMIRKTLNEHLRLKGYGYARPNRRYRLDPFILPGRQYQVANVAALVDVSGSINEKSARQAFKLGAQLRGLGIKLRVVACDDHAMEVTSNTKSAYGGGGTTLSRGLDLIDQTMPDTDVCICISDGETHPWGEKRRYPVILFTWGREGAEWMKTIRMPVL